MKNPTAVLLLFFLNVSLAVPADLAALGGFSNETSAAERDWEAKFRAIPDPANLRAYMQRLSRAAAPRRLALR